MRAVRPGLLVQQVGNRVFDWLNDMDTAAEVSRGALGFTDERLGMHGATSWRSVVEVRQLLHGLEISQRDAFMDVGCGKGRMVCVAAQYPFARVVGVEISPELSTVARANVARNQRKFRSPMVEVVTADVRVYASQMM